MKLNNFWVYGVVVLGLLGFTPGESGYFNETREMDTILSIDPCQMDNYAFKGGEQVTYKIYYNWNFIWLSAGEVTFSIKETKDEIHISAVGVTYSTYEWFFKVKDYYATVLDKKTLLPKVFIRDIEEGNYKIYNKIEFDQEGRKAVNFKGKTKDQLKTTEYVFDHCMHDMLSMIYYLRNVDYSIMKKKSKFPVKIFLDGKHYHLDVTYKGPSNSFKVKSSGKYNVLHFSPEMIAGKQFNEGTVMDVYVSNDKNKVPVMVESPVSVGSIKAVLIDHKGLRHPFTGKLN